MGATTTAEAAKPIPNPAPRRPRQWSATSYAEVARFFGVALDTVKRWAAAGMPKSRPYDLAAIVAWLRESGPWRPRGEAAETGADPSPTDDVDPLDRFRAGRARLTELEIGEREGKLVRRERVHGDLARFAAVLRRAGERLQREFGARAHEILDTALNDALRIADGLSDDRRNA